MYYYLYQITNLINNKIYIGAHRTDDLEDGYMGSGKWLKRAIKKYNLENFTKHILNYFETEDEMYLEERNIVDYDFIKRKDTYNIVLGGRGGLLFKEGTPEWESWHKKFIDNNPIYMDKNSEEYKKWYITNCNNAPFLRDKNSEEYRNWFEKQQESLPNLKSKSSSEYLSWFIKNNLAKPSTQDKNSDRYLNWLQKQRDSRMFLYDKDSEKFKQFKESVNKNSPWAKDKTSEEYISWYENNKKAQQKFRGCIWIKNNDNTINKKIKPEEFEFYSNLGWIRGKLNKRTRINKDN